MYAIKDTRKNRFEDDGDGLTVYFTEKEKVDHMVAEANKVASRYEVVEVNELNKHALINHFILIRPESTVAECLTQALREAPERSAEIDALRDKILALPIVTLDQKPRQASSYRVGLVAWSPPNDAGFVSTGLHQDVIEMMRDVLRETGEDIREKLKESSSLAQALQFYEVTTYDDAKREIGTRPLADFERAFRLLEQQEGDRILYGSERSKIPHDAYEIESIETESNKVESSGSLIVLAGPAGRVYAVHAGDLLECEMTFLKKPTVKAGFRP